MSRVPEAARRKLAAIEQSASDAAALSSAAASTLARLQTELHNLRDRGGDEDEERRLDSEMRAVRETQTRRRERRTSDSQVLARITTFLDRLPRTMALEPAEVREPDADARADPARALVAARKELGALSAELIRERSAPPTREEAVAGLDAWVDRAAEESTPGLDLASFSLTFERDSRDLYRGARPVTLAGALCWLDSDRMKVRARELVAATIPSGGTPHAERAVRAEQLEEAILRAERREEALVCLALDRGLDAQRRPAADPRAVLGVRVVAVGRRKKERADAA